MQANLHSYQEEAVRYAMTKKKCGLWLDMGLGKTLASLTAIQRLRDEFLIYKTLVIAPLRVANNVWSSEVSKWDHTNHLNVSIVTGSESNRLLQLKKDSDIYVINRENIPWLLKFGYKDYFDMIVVDESSSFKSSSSKRFKALKKFSCEYMIQLTGTPAPNGLLDIWSQIYLIDQGKALGKTFTSYKNNMFNSDYMGYNFTPKSTKDIYSSVSDLVVSMKSEDYLELPDKLHVETKVDIGCLKQYRELEKEFILELGDQVYEAKNAAVLSGKLLQLSNGSLYKEGGGFETLHDEKLRALEELIEDNPNTNLLVAYNFKSDLIRIRKKFKQAVTLDDGNDVMDRWCRGDIKLLLCQPASDSMGLNLQHGGNTIIWFGLTWNLEHYMQFNGRIHRQGQTKPVVINHIVARGTVDERVLVSLQDKKSTQDDLFSSVLFRDHGDSL